MPRDLKPEDRFFVWRLSHGGVYAYETGSLESACQSVDDDGDDSAFDCVEVVSPNGASRIIAWDDAYKIATAARREREKTKPTPPVVAWLWLRHPTTGTWGCVKTFRDVAAASDASTDLTEAAGQDRVRLTSDGRPPRVP